jgi:hypothetical protein
MSRPDQTSRIIPPCKDCVERHTACHDHCERFKEYKAIREKENEARRQYERKPFVQYNPFDY